MVKCSLSGRQLFAALGPSAVHNASSGSGGHSFQEAMFSGTFDSAGLEGSFHL